MCIRDRYYAVIYPRFSYDKFHRLTELFRLDSKRNLNTFSKGMQKQAHIILALACEPDYLFCDETFDGLDPVMRQAVKRLLADAVVEQQLTPIIASHNLRELEEDVYKRQMQRYCCVMRQKNNNISTSGSIVRHCGK